MSESLPVQALVVVRFHATKGQEIVSIYPPTSHGLTEQQLVDVKMLAMQECIESSPNQKQRFAVKIRDKGERLPATCTPSSAAAVSAAGMYQAEPKVRNDSDSNSDMSMNAKASVRVGGDMYAYSCFTRCRDAKGSERGYFNQSTMLITSVHQSVGLNTAAGCAYRNLFYEVLERLCTIIADLPAMQEAMSSLRNAQSESESVEVSSAKSSLETAKSAEEKEKEKDALVFMDELSPTAHTWAELHQMLEVAWIHFQQWRTAGWSVPSSRARTGAKPEYTAAVAHDLPFFGVIFKFSLPIKSPTSAFGLEIRDESHPLACLTLARLGLLPHIWTLWELLIRGRDIVIYAPSAAVTSSAILAIAELLLPPDAPCSGYDIRPYITAYDSDVNHLLTQPRSTTTLAHTSIKSRPPCARLVGISNPFLLRSFESYDCAILLPNPDIGYAVSSIYSGTTTAVAATPAEVASKKEVNVDSTVKALSRGLSAIGGGLTALFTSSASPSRSDALAQYTDAKIDFSPLGVGFLCSASYSQYIQDNPDQCFDLDDKGRKTYQPVIGPYVEGTPYRTVGAISVSLRLVDSSGGLRNSCSSYERVYDDWIARKAHRMPLGSASDVRGTSNGSHNHSKYSPAVSTNNNSGKCHGMILLRLQGQGSDVKASGPGNGDGDGVGLVTARSPEKEVQTQLDAVLCAGITSPGSAIVIADVILREHIFNLNTAVLAPFELQRDMYSLDCEASTRSHTEEVDEFNSFYALETLPVTESNRFDTEAEADDTLGDTELLMGAIAAFQRKHMPSTAQMGIEDPDAERVYVPSCIRKVFYDHSSSFKSGGSRRSGGVCSPFMLDVASSRFIYDWLRLKR